MGYPDFKSYIQDKLGDLLKTQIAAFVNENHDAHGFHSVNVLSLCNQEVDNVTVMSLRCTNKPGMNVEIAVNLTADIVTLGLGAKRYEADRKQRWFTVRLTALIRDGLKIDEDSIHVTEYASNTFDKSTALDEFLVPYIYSADLEDLADDFVEFYCLDAPYWDRYVFPAEHVLYQLEMGLYEADLPEKTMGRVYFREDKATVYRSYPYFGESKHIDEEIRPGTILVSKNNHFMNNPGSGILTIVHEIMHWYYHQKFFAILSLLDSNTTMMPCETEPVVLDEGMSSLQKALWFAEWQANSLAMRVAMPQALFAQAFQEAYDSALQIPRKGSFRAEVLEDTIERLGKLFAVSKFTAKQRAIQLGADVADGTLLYIDGQYHKPFYFKEGTLGPRQTFVIGKDEFDRLHQENTHFADLMESGQFIYLGYVVCINDEKYVRRKSQDELYWQEYEYDLTPYARDHVDECCLIFGWHSKYGENDYDGFYGQCYLSKDISAQNRIEHIYDKDFKNNQTAESVAAEIAKYRKAFMAEEQVLREVPNNFSEALKYHMQRKNISVEDLAERSHLSETTIKNYRAGKKTPGIENIMAVFIGLNLPERYCKHMLRTLGRTLDDMDDKQKVYLILIREHSDGNIDQWNQILTGFGLGTIPNRRNQKSFD